MRQMAHRALLLGAAAGPVFAALVLGQALVREGFQLTHHPLSLLALGKWGWIQTVNFAITGLAAAAAGYGLSRRAGAAPLIWLLGGYALGLLLAAAFPSPPAMNFPPGSVEPATPPASPMLHGLGFGVATFGMIGAALLLSMQYHRRKQRAWSQFSLAAALLPPAITAAGFASEAWRGLCFFSAAIISLSWLTLVCIEHLAHFAEEGRRS